MRPKVIQIRRLTRDEQRISALLYPERNFWRPQTRQDCSSFSRPCPYVGCRHHLYLDVDAKSGSIRLNHPGKEVWDLKHTCSLDIADLPSEPTLEDIGEVMAVTRERVRQIESVALSRLKAIGVRTLIDGEVALASRKPRLRSADSAGEQTKTEGQDE